MAKTLSRQDLNRLLAEQKRIASITFQDEENKKLMLLGLTGGIVSGLALKKLYLRLTPDPQDDGSLATMLGAGAMAVGIGVFSIWLKVNRAQFSWETGIEPEQI